MRSVLAIVLALALLCAPMALFAAAWECACAPPYCTMACCHNGKCMMMQHEQCRGATPAVRCDCMRLPNFAMLAPLTEMLLGSRVPMPLLERAPSNPPALALGVLPGFLPSPFHPPRG